MGIQVWGLTFLWERLDIGGFGDYRRFFAKLFEQSPFLQFCPSLSPLKVWLPRLETFSPEFHLKVHCSLSVPIQIGFRDVSPELDLSGSYVQTFFSVGFVPDIFRVPTWGGLGETFLSSVSGVSWDTKFRARKVGISRPFLRGLSPTVFLLRPLDLVSLWGGHQNYVMFSVVWPPRFIYTFNPRGG